jgi:hypothetical protein
MLIRQTEGTKIVTRKRSGLVPFLMKGGSVNYIAFEK